MPVSSANHAVSSANPAFNINAAPAKQPDQPNHPKQRGQMVVVPSYEQHIKRHMQQYWSQRADSFAELHNREFESPMRARWEAELRAKLPTLPAVAANRPLRVLDMGCGSGFMSLVLASMGHRVMGIDGVQEMVDKARAAAAAHGLDVQFERMDAENPRLEPASFDVIVSRNLTWALPNISAAYGNWYKLLRDGGVLINFDGDYAHAAPSKDGSLKQCDAHNAISHNLQREYEHIREHLSDLQLTRPAWDVELLAEAGFHDIVIDNGVSDRVYVSRDEFYNPEHTFCIRAVR